MLAEPVGNATPNTAERSTFLGIVLICHFTAGATSENPEPSRPRTFAKYVGRPQEFETVCNACAQTCICAVHKPTAVSPTGINAVLDLQTARRHNNTGVHDVGSIGANLVLGRWTIVGLRADRAVIDKQCQQGCCEFSNAYGPASERKCSPCNN